MELRSACYFDREAMVPSTGARTIFDKAQIVLIRLGNDRFRVEVWRTFATQLWELLQAASYEIALDI
jgi:sarcosine oxidase, subunit gamma